MKNIIITLTACVFTQLLYAQLDIDTVGKLIEQKEKIISASTIIQIENLGTKINSRLPELRPTISADGNLLFFICEGHPSNTNINQTSKCQDIWYSVRDTLTGKWYKAQHMDYPFNTAINNAVFWISPDKNTLLIRNAFVDGDYYGNGMSFSQLQEDGWSKPQMLRIKNYDKYDKGLFSGATMASDGRTLLFYGSETRNSPFNSIYVSFLQPDSSWSEFKSLGKKINIKEYDQLTPYLASDGVSLYFSSNRPGGKGEYDIWMSKRLDNSWQKWSEPESLDTPINSTDNDMFFTMDAGGEFAYMTSNYNSYGNSDIVRIKLLEKQKPDPVVLVDGNVYNAKTKKPLSATLIYETLPDGVMAGTGNSNTTDGSFQIVLPYDKNYLIRANADKYFAQTENLNLDSLIKSGFRRIHKDLYLMPIEIGQTVRLNNVFFDFDKWDLRPESFIELNLVVKMLNENPKLEIELGAHTDSRGSDEYNIKLSDHRAKSCVDYIISKGIDPVRVTWKGYGETVPVATNDTDEGRQLNRRVEFKIMNN
ncbi:MAG: OmpA family protein [Sphingobacteriales bacterium]|nr:OmpA family protein [Sphingobacteriales bacterium]MBI3718497.1 OmpA family protein [Sphingobacteriales bacterium]